MGNPSGSGGGGGRISKARVAEAAKKVESTQVRMADVHLRDGTKKSMTADEYESWKKDQPRGSHRATFRMAKKK